MIVDAYSHENKIVDVYSHEKLIVDTWHQISAELVMPIHMGGDFAGMGTNIFCNYSSATSKN